mmetsp:Transcript_7177/g.23809  ORF Transcript_7177/g.23809 Transcript_7177/m.23809 type:complete len:200 (-) Transcript_7177:2335-2934(-)
MRNSTSSCYPASHTVRCTSSITRRRGRRREGTRAGGTGAEATFCGGSEIRSRPRAARSSRVRAGGNRAEEQRTTNASKPRLRTVKRSSSSTAPPGRAARSASTSSWRSTTASAATTSPTKTAKAFRARTLCPSLRGSERRARAALRWAGASSPNASSSRTRRNAGRSGSPLGSGPRTGSRTATPSWTSRATISGRTASR